MFVAKQSLSLMELLSETSARRPTDRRVSEPVGGNPRRGDSHITTADVRIDSFGHLQNLWAQQRAATVRVRARMSEEIRSEFELRSRASERLREHIDAQVDSYLRSTSIHQFDFREELDARPRGQRPQMPKSGVQRIDLPDSVRTRSRDDEERVAEHLETDAPELLDLLG